MMNYFRWLLSIFIMGASLSACSDDAETDIDLMPEETIDPRGYYYEGMVTLFDAYTNNRIYYVYNPMMYPMYYGYCIPLPLPDRSSIVNVALGENTVIEKQSVKYTYNGEEFCADMPIEGTIEYRPGFSITRVAKDEFTVYFDINKTPIYDDEFAVLTRPIPFWAFDDSQKRPNRIRSKFENPEDYNLPAEIDVKFMPYTFLDHYRPLMQYNLRVR